MVELDLRDGGVASHFSFTHTEEGGLVTARLTGEVDAAASTEMRAALSALVSPPVSAIDIDTSRVTFMDSSGLGALIALQKEAEAHEIALRIVEPSDPVSRLLRITAMEERLTGKESVS